MLERLITTPYSIEQAMKHNQRILHNVEYMPISLVERIYFEFMVEKAHNPEWVAAFMSVAIGNVNIYLTYTPTITTDISWEEFVDAFISVKTSLIF